MGRVVVALGGNALLKRGEEMTADNQRKNAKIAAEALALFAKRMRLSLPMAMARRSGCWPCKKSCIPMLRSTRWTFWSVRRWA